MPAIPSKASFTGASVTETQMKTAIETLHDYLTGLLGSDGLAATALAALGALAAFPAGTRLLFQQTSAPTGWTKVTDAAYNDAAMRIVTGAVGTGGADAFSTHFGAGKVSGGTSITQANLPNCSFTVSDPGHAHVEDSETYVNSPGTNFTFTQASGIYLTTNTIGGRGPISTAPATTGITVSSGGSGTAHTHALNNFNIKYADCVVCTKD